MHKCACCFLFVYILNLLYMFLIPGVLIVKTFFYLTYCRDQTFYEILKSHNVFFLSWFLIQLFFYKYLKGILYRLWCQGLSYNYLSNIMNSINNNKWSSFFFTIHCPCIFTILFYLYIYLKVLKFHLF